jgi:voltage-gated potassium channel
MTTIGKVLAGIIMLSGVAFFALPAGIITAGFLEEMKFMRKYKGHKCPHCGNVIEEHPHHKHLDEKTDE